MKRDDQIFDIIEKEHQRQLKGIELIASENFVSEEVMKAIIHMWKGIFSRVSKM